MKKDTRIKEALTKVLPRSSSPSMNPNNWSEEGVDHINISRRSSHTVGRFLDIDCIKSFEHPLFGTFKSLTELSYILRVVKKPDRFPDMNAVDLRNYIDRVCGGYLSNVPNYEAVMMHSAYLRVLSFPGYAEALRSSTLPFDNYRVLPSGIRRHFANAGWIISGYTEIRKALQENREPDFTFLRRDHNNFYLGVLRQLAPASVEVVEPNLSELSARLREHLPKPAKKQKTVVTGA